MSGYSPRLPSNCFISSRYCKVALNTGPASASPLKTNIRRLITPVRVWRESGLKCRQSETKERTTAISCGEDNRRPSAVAPFLPSFVCPECSTVSSVC